MNQINLLDPLPYEAPEEVHADDLEVVGEETISASDSKESESNSKTKGESDSDADDEGQITLF